MTDHDRANVLIVRGAGPAGRRIAKMLGGSGVTTVVLDERTSAHEGIHAVRVPFEDVVQPRRAVDDLTVRYGSFAAMVLLPPPNNTNTDGSRDPLRESALDPSWELDLGQELTLVAGLVRVAAPALEAGSGIVVPVGAPPQRHEPTHRAMLLTQSYMPALGALATEFGIRLAPVETGTTGTARGTVVASRLLEELGLATAGTDEPVDTAPGATSR